MKRRITIVMCAGLAMAQFSPHVAGASPRNGRILFRRFLNADHTTGDVFSIRPNGSGLTRVTHSGKNVVGTEPNPSPDGRWIAYMEAPGNDIDHARLYKIRPNGKGRTDLSKSCDHACRGDGFSNWSRSGKLIAFQRLMSTQPYKPVGFTAIFVMRADGTHVHQVTLPSADPGQPSALNDQAPAWDPNGPTLAFERFSEKRGHQAIFTVRMGGRHLRRITPWQMDASQPDYSPDGRWIAFRSNEESDIKGNIWLVHPNGGGLHAVTHAPAGEAKWLSCAFSPDGRFIVAARTRIVGGDQQNADVYVMRVDGSDRRDVTKTPGSWESGPDWSVGRG